MTAVDLELLEAPAAADLEIDIRVRTDGHHCFHCPAQGQQVGAGASEQPALRGAASIPWGSSRKENCSIQPNLLLSALFTPWMSSGATRAIMPLNAPGARLSTSR